MATIALPRPILPTQSSSRSVKTPVTSSNSLQNIATPVVGATSSSQQFGHTPIPIPNKHLPDCSGGSAVKPTGASNPSFIWQGEEAPQSSILYPTDNFTRITVGRTSVFEIEAVDVARALNFAAKQPLPSPDLVFPWLHGLHPQNHMQQAFFNGRRRVIQKSPLCLRAVTIVKADGNLHVARLKGAIAPGEIMQPGSTPDFIEPDPLDGFSVRNFHIQPGKIALISDIIVYGDDQSEGRKLARDIAIAQQRWREKQSAIAGSSPEYNTFVCISPFLEFEQSYGELVCIDSSGASTGRVLDFAYQERREMFDMTAASEISPNVYLGPSPEPGSPEEHHFDVLIECSDLGRLNPTALQAVAEHPDQSCRPLYHDFPSSGSILPPTWSHVEADGILETCKWIYHISHGSLPLDHTDNCDGENSSKDPVPCTTIPESGGRKVLIHCPDGYTETTMLGIAYFSYSTGRPVPEAWLNLHTAKGRNFFAYPSDVSLLSAIAPRLLYESPFCTGQDLTSVTVLTKDEPGWFTGLDGSFPSRILDYLYLGNLGHANNPELLRKLNISQILSVGETASWREEDVEQWGQDNVCIVKGVQDNGIDPLTNEFERCLKFINEGRKRGVATLVHCRVGVSRSATICIAEVMRALNFSFPRAYCFVRARRLNVIIQPHLRFVYELMLWEEILQQNGDSKVSVKREMEWAEITREIALMNRPYSR